MHHHHHRHRRHHAHRGPAFLALGLGLAAGLLGCGVGPRHHRDHAADPDARAEAILSRLDATEAERQALRPLLRDLAVELAALRARGASLRDDVLGGWRDDRVEAARLRERADTELEAMRQALHRVADRVAALHAAMTPAQREQLARFADRRWH